MPVRLLWVQHLQLKCLENFFSIYKRKACTVRAFDNVPTCLHHCVMTVHVSHHNPLSSPSLMGESANAATDTAHCETFKHLQLRIRVKQKHCSSFAQTKNNKFAPSNRALHRCLPTFSLDWLQLKLFNLCNIFAQTRHLHLRSILISTAPLSDLIHYHVSESILRGMQTNFLSLATDTNPNRCIFRLLVARHSPFSCSINNSFFWIHQQALKSSITSLSRISSPCLCPSQQVAAQCCYLTASLTYLIPILRITAPEPMFYSHGHIMLTSVDVHTFPSGAPR